MNLSSLSKGKNKFILYLFLSLSSGILLWLGWPPKHNSSLMFIAFVPILLLERYISLNETGGNSRKFFLYSYLSLLTWNFLTTFWIRFATMTGSILTIILNALLMFMPLLLYHKTRLKAGKQLSYIALPVFWLAFEYLHLNWDLSWPWLTLGNSFAVKTEWIQWYQFTGVLGGSLWIWIMNLVIADFLCNFIFPQDKYKKQMTAAMVLLSAFLVFAIPVMVSAGLKIKESVPTGKNVVIIQPNIDPYHEKFEPGTQNDQISKLLSLSSSAVDSNTALLVWPETAISNAVDERRLNDDPTIIRIRGFLKKHPGVRLMTGLDSYRFYGEGEKISPTARLYLPESLYYESHNSALLLKGDSSWSIYYKSRLVPGVEKMPYPRLFRFLEKYAINMGGTSGSLGKQDKPSVFRISDSIVAAPAICYESIYGDYLGRFVRIGANIIVVMTNDGWWGNTDGYKQHFDYAALRAVELRKDVIRSANTGISAYIDSRGEVKNKTGYWMSAIIKHGLSVNNTVTFYARHGDYIGRMASVLTAMILLWLVIRPRQVTKVKML